MKKIIAVILLLAMLLCVSACGRQPVQTERDLAQYKSPDEEKVEEQIDTDYIIKTVGEPDLNGNGDVIGDCHFEKLVFTNPNESLEKINRQISDICDDFVWGDNGEAYRGCLQFIYDQSPDDLVKYPYVATADIESVYIEDDCLCVLMVYNWFCGGVYNTNFTGLNFNLKTGEKMYVSELFDDADTASGVIIEATLDHMARNGGPDYYSDNSTEVVMNYDVNDYNFYFDKDTLSIVYNTYELASGAAGPITVVIPR